MRQKSAKSVTEMKPGLTRSIVERELRRFANDVESKMADNQRILGAGYFHLRVSPYTYDETMREIIGEAMAERGIGPAR